MSDNAVVQPLRPVVRIATADDLRVEELNRKREREAFEICQQKIAGQLEDWWTCATFFLHL